MSSIPEFLFGPPEIAAPQLLGWHLVSTAGGFRTEVAITEVEAYAPDDPASHAFRGVRPGNAAMFGRAGTLYVYRSYGIHWCANVVCGGEDVGAAVLIRAAEPIDAFEKMVERRGRQRDLLNGPGKLTQALAIDITHNGTDLFAPASQISLVPGEPPPGYAATPRIGISRAVEVPWRFVAVEEVGTRSNAAPKDRRGRGGL